MQFEFVSITHVEEHPSPVTKLESSHYSLLVLYPFPQTVVQLSFVKGVSLTQL